MYIVLDRYADYFDCVQVTPTRKAARKVAKKYRKELEVPKGAVRIFKLTEVR